MVKWGNSLGLRIPKSFAEDIRIADGSAVDLTMEDGRLVIRVARSADLSLADLLADVTDANLHRTHDTDDAVGGEHW